MKPDPDKTVLEETVPCEACGSRGIISWATDDIRCDACAGTGKVPDGSAKPDPGDHRPA